MKIKLFILRLLSPALLSTVTYFSSAQSGSTVFFLDENVKKVAPGVAKYKGIATIENEKTGISVYEIKSGLLAMKGTYTDSTLSVKEGIFSYYDDKEKEGIRCEYSQNKKNGYWIAWSSGYISDSVLYENDKERARTTYEYFPNGILKSRIANDARVNSSDISLFDSEGRVERNAKWINGSGDQIYFYQNGKTKCIETYKDRKLVSSVYYNPDGQKLSVAKSKKEREKMLADYHKKIDDEEPSFPGGTAAFRTFFEKNFKAPATSPQEARNITAVRVSFFLNEKGNAYNIVTDEHMNMDFRKAIETVFKQMPSWTMKGHTNFGPIVYSLSLVASSFN